MVLAVPAIASRIRSWNESAERCLESRGNEAAEDSASSSEADTRNFVTVVQNDDLVKKLKWECKKRDLLRG